MLGGQYHVNLALVKSDTLVNPIVFNTLGIHVSLSLRRNLARSSASSLIRVSIVCCLPTRIRRTRTFTSKNWFKSLANSLVSYAQR